MSDGTAPDRFEWLPNDAMVLWQKSGETSERAVALRVGKKIYLLRFQVGKTNSVTELGSLELT